MDNNSKRVLLIVLTVIILGPLLFIGACFPLGLIGFGLGFENTGTTATIGGIIFIGAWIVGLALAILVLYLIIKKINKKFNDNK